jgi:hypothetical protein
MHAINDDNLFSIKLETTIQAEVLVPLTGGPIRNT